jgi:hypothetical protein
LLKDEIKVKDALGKEDRQQHNSIRAEQKPMIGLNPDFINHDREQNDERNCMFQHRVSKFKLGVDQRLIIEIEKGSGQENEKICQMGKIYNCVKSGGQQQKSSGQENTKINQQ